MKPYQGAMLSSTIFAVILYIASNSFELMPKELNTAAVCVFIWVASLIFAWSNRTALNKMTNDAETNRKIMSEVFFGKKKKK